MAQGAVCVVAEGDRSVMKLTYFRSAHGPLPSGMQFQLASPTASFAVPFDCEDISCNASGTLVQIHRKDKPDIIFTPMGAALMDSDAVAVPGNATKMPVLDEQRGQKGRR